MRSTLTIAMAIVAIACCQALDRAPRKLQFDPTAGEPRTMTMVDGSKVNYVAYEKLYYVTNIEDSAYQYLNVYVPENAGSESAILLRTYVGGYMASRAGQPQAGDASGRALQEGMVVVIPGTRGRNSSVTARKSDKKAGIKKGQSIFTGRAPNAILDLKAAIRYLRYFDDELPGDAEKIITDGTSAGGAMSALMGATGNNPAYEPLLKAMGAAPVRDDVMASVCYCPIIDLEHADMAYEWLYNCTDSRQQGSLDVLAVSDQLKEQFPAYLESLSLHTDDGTLLTAANYLDYIKKELIRSAQIAKNAGAEIPDSLGFSFSDEASFGAPPINGGMGSPAGKIPLGGERLVTTRGGMKKRAGEYIVDLDMNKYLNYVVSTQPLKTAPAFDTQGVAGQRASGENEEFGDWTGSSVNFTDYGAMMAGSVVSEEVKRNVALMNPMNYIGDSVSDVAQYWYIRHGARDRDTAFPVPINLALKLKQAGKSVNFLLAWNRPHSGDYALDEMFMWIKQCLLSKKLNENERFKKALLSDYPAAWQ